MSSDESMTPETTAIRAHDITVCLQQRRSSEYDVLPSIGLAVRLALHLRGVPAVSFQPLKNLCVHVLNFQPAEVVPVLQLLAAAEFVDLITEGKSIKRVVPQVPFFDTLYETIGTVGVGEGLTEPEALSLAVVNRLSSAPHLRGNLDSLGAEPALMSRVLSIGEDGGFIKKFRARGRDVFLSPAHFGEHHQEYADVAAAHGSGRTARVLGLLASNQGWPLAKLRKDGELGGCRLDAQDLAIVEVLGGGGLIRPPAITTGHAGTNFFLFGPRPGIAQLPLNQKDIYERAMALVAAVRQGQFLPKQFRIHSPLALLNKLKEAGSLRSNSEALQQYRGVAELRVGRIELSGVGRHSFVLNDAPENHKAVDLAIQLFTGSAPVAAIDDDVALALKSGDRYVESLVGSSLLVQGGTVSLDSESRTEIEDIILGSVPNK